jgi:SAM-dependent methyltransferase
MTEIPVSARTKLNLGCGRRQFPDHVNVDLIADVVPDVVHDLNRTPFPFADSAFGEVCAYDVVEHVADLPAFMREVWRVARGGAVFRVTTPHYSCNNSYTDPTHVRHLGYYSLDYFTPEGKWNFYGGAGFEIRQRAIIFAPSLVNRLVGRWANRNPSAYESRWAWIFPAWFLNFELVVRK